MIEWSSTTSSRIWFSPESRPNQAGTHPVLGSGGLEPAHGAGHC
ncbi:hypothetical protein [Kibdelosporangium philippinense]